MSKSNVLKVQESPSSDVLIEWEEKLASFISYRRPKQARGVQKFETIVDAAHELIIARGVHNFGLYDIAEHAGVAVGSIYHFFPSIEAVHAALVERYDREFFEIVKEEIPTEQVQNWSDVIWQHIEKSRNYINENEPVMIMLIGPGQTWNTRQIDTVGDTIVACAMLENLERFFDVPHHPDPVELLHLSIRILESFWQLSYQRDGRVTKDMQQETYRAMCAYLELYWPKFMKRKEPEVVD